MQMNQSKIEITMENSEFGFKPETHEIINEQLKDHQIAADWDKHGLIQDIHIWAERFIFAFKLKIEESPAIMIDIIGRSTYGHFRPGRNGFGLRNEIALNQRFIDTREYWDVLGTLLHELLHLEQELAGKPGKHNYHNKAYRERAVSFGLIVDEWGRTKYAPAPSPFWDILGKQEIAAPAILPSEPTATAPGNSKLKLWVCECKPRPVHVRVAIEDFQAKCLKCGAIFRKQTNQLSGEDSNV
jgi:hypothetical protein